MKTKLLAGLSAAFLATAFMAPAAFASCGDRGSCVEIGGQKRQAVKKQSTHKQGRVASVKRYSTKRVASRVASLNHSKTKRRAHVQIASTTQLSGKRIRSNAALAALVPRGREPVVAMIKSMAPRYGVPTWFALRIARVESNYNPRVRGSAGEYGVFQLKCATARGIGFRGNCGNLLNASTNIQFGLRHLQMAMRSSRGNLQLAASKHNGGLGRKTLVRGYVSRVF